MKKTLLFSVATAMLATLTSLHAQSTETRTINLSGSYDAISVSGSHIVNFDIGPAGNPATVIGAPEDLDNLSIDVRNNTLYVSYKNNYNSRNNKRVEVYVKNPTLKTATVSGSGTVNIAGNISRSDNSFTVSGSGKIVIDRIECDDVSFRVTGSGSVNCLSIKADDISTSVSGSGRVDLSGITAEDISASVTGSGRTILSGTVEDLTAGVSGSGSIDARLLIADDATVKVTGSGSLHTKCTNEFDATVSGSGKIYYYGEPARIRMHGKTKQIIQK